MRSRTARAIQRNPVSKKKKKKKKKKEKKRKEKENLSEGAVSLDYTQVVSWSHCILPSINRLVFYLC